MRPMKNIFVFKFEGASEITAEQLENVMNQNRLRECGTHDIETYGWIPAFSQGQHLVEEINDSLFFRLGMEIKKLPRKAIMTEVEKRAQTQHIDIQNRKNYKELEEEVTEYFIHNTYPEQDSINAYIDLKNEWLVIDVPTEKKASLVTAVLRKTLGALPVTRLAPQVEIPFIMTDWLRMDTLNNKFQELDEVELRELGKDDGGIARYKGIPLHSEEIENSLNGGWYATKLALVYEDLVSFKIDKDFVLKGVKYLDSFQERIADSDDALHHARSTAYLQADTNRSLVTDLFNAFYGK